MRASCAEAALAFRAASITEVIFILKATRLRRLSSLKKGDVVAGDQGVVVAVFDQLIDARRMLATDAARFVARIVDDAAREFLPAFIDDADDVAALERAAHLDHTCC